jgi:hypothetical protein
MGAWSHEPIGNDDALDFLDDLSAEPSWTLVRAAFLPTQNDDYLEAPEASAAVAAAAVVSAARAGREIDEQYPGLVGKLGTMPPDLPQITIAALTKVGAGSELDELWSDSEDYEAWRATLSQLENELK